MLFVTLHGGNPEANPHKNNVHAYDNNGGKITPCVLADSEGVTLNELRGIYLVNRYLYLVNANKDQNGVLCYQGSGTKYEFASKFVSSANSAGVLHPFDITFDDAGFCYLSSQDTNVVTRLKASKDGKTGIPAPIAPALPANGTFASGTFVASSVGGLNQPTTPVPPPAGLEYSAEGAKKHSVRGVLWSNGALYVADQPACRVKVYDRAGRFLGQSNRVESPVHLVASKGNLYVSGGDEVLSAKLPNPPGNFTFSPIKGIKVKNGGGMAFSDSGHFYLASRTENIILKFDSSFNPINFQCELPDNPEFLLHI